MELLVVRTREPTGILPKQTIVIGFVHPDKVHSLFMASIIRLLRAEGQRIEQVIGIHSGPKVDDARNELFKAWLTSTNANRLMMVDTDMIPPDNTIKRLLGHNKDIVGGLCFAGTGSTTVKPVIHVVRADEDGKPTIEIMWDYPLDQLIEVDATGGACMMITRKCAEGVWKARGPNHPMPWFAHGMHNGVRIGEDVGFCLTAQKVGYKVFVDTGLEVPHIKSFNMGQQDYVRSLMQESHPHYNRRSEVPVFQEVIDGYSSLGGTE